MQDIMTLLGTLKRPRLLIQAARIGGEHYQRDVHLPRLLRDGDTPRGGSALMQLVDLEALHDERRRRQDPAYNIAAHVEVLAAMMGEAKLLRAQIARAATPDLRLVSPVSEPA